MGFFNIFSKKNSNENAVNISLSAAEPAEAKESIENVPVAQTDDKSTGKPLTVSYATGWPIDVVYGYLHKNYEDKGFADAMMKSDLAFRDMNLRLIRNKILMTFREINLTYDAMKNDLDTRIENCNAAGLLTNIAELNKQMSVINAHKEELAQLEADFRNNTNEASVPLMSYECGFLRGISTINMASPSKTNVLQAPVVPTLNKQSMAV